MFSIAAAISDYQDVKKAISNQEQRVLEKKYSPKQLSLSMKVKIITLDPLGLGLDFHFI